MEQLTARARFGLSVGLGLLLGHLILVNWSPYHDYAIVVAPVSIEYTLAVLAGCMIAWFSGAGEAWLGLEVLALAIALAVPVAANVTSAFLIGNEILLDIILYSALRGSLAHAVALAVFFAIGAASGLVIRAWKS